MKTKPEKTEVRYILQSKVSPNAAEWRDEFVFTTKVAAVRWARKELNDTACNWRNGGKRQWRLISLVAERYVLKETV